MTSAIHGKRMFVSGQLVEYPLCSHPDLSTDPPRCDP